MCYGRIKCYRCSGDSCVDSTALTDTNYYRDCDNDSYDVCNKLKIGET